MLSINCDRLYRNTLYHVDDILLNTRLVNLNPITYSPTEAATWIKHLCFDTHKRINSMKIPVNTDFNQSYITVHGLLLAQLYEFIMCYHLCSILIAAGSIKLLGDLDPPERLSFANRWLNSVQRRHKAQCRT